MAKIKNRLKTEQLSRATQEGVLIPIERMGQRLRDYREALGMTQSQLAKRLKIKQPVISKIEEDATSSSFKTIIKIAKALECDFLGSIVSDQTITTKIKHQAERAAKKMLARTNANMAMEKQAVGRDAYPGQLERLIEDLSAKPGPELWEE